MSALLLVAVGVAFFPVFYKLAVMGWNQADYTHAYFLVPIFIWLIYRKRDHLRRSDRVSIAGSLVLAAGIAVYIFSRLNEFMFIEAASCVLLVWGIFLLRYTRASVAAVFFPLAYLIFIIPPPFIVVDGITMPLKTIATHGSYTLLKCVGLPVSLSGAILRVGSYDFFVAEACSGYRSMVTLLALGSLYAYLQKTTMVKKWIIFLSVIPLGIVGNIFRIFVTGCIGHFAGIQYAEGFFHEFSGGVVFLIAIFGLMFITDKLVDSHDV